MARFLFKQWYACSGGRYLMDHVFFQSEPSTFPVTYIYKRALHIAHPFSAAHHHNLFIYWNSEFSKFSTSSPSACLWTILFFLFVVGGASPPPPPTFAEELLSILYSVGLRIKIRHLWWPKLCQTMLTLSLLTRPFSKLVRRHAVLVCSLNFSAPLQPTTAKRLVIKYLKDFYNSVSCKAILISFFILIIFDKCLPLSSCKLASPSSLQGRNLSASIKNIFMRQAPGISGKFWNFLWIINDLVRSIRKLLLLLLLLTFIIDLKRVLCTCFWR